MTTTTKETHMRDPQPDGEQGKARQTCHVQWHTHTGGPTDRPLNTCQYDDTIPAREEYSDLPSRAFMEYRCLTPPHGCGQPRNGGDEAGPRETEWVRTGLCPDCQGAPTPVTATDAPS